MGIPKESQFHVLAVDDSIIDRKLIERLLKISSFQVTTVDSASKALQFLGVDENEQTKPDQPFASPKTHQEVQVNLIITDYCMPGMTGYDLLKRVKESSSLRNIPVVIMSSENVPSRITRCLEEGADEFFLKPVKLADVNKLKSHIMRTRSQIQEQEEQNQEAESVKTEEVVQLRQQPAPPNNNNNTNNCSITNNNTNNDINNNNNNNIKNYKVIEEGIGEDRARHSRYSGLTVA